MRVGVICGGKSVEHEVSLQSAKNIINALQLIGHDPIVIGIDKQGTWSYLQLDALQRKFQEAALFALDQDLVWKPLSFDSLKDTIDMAFCIVHGAYGEDGSIQGLLRCLDIPYAGPTVLDAALSMDKEVFKRLLKSTDIPIARFLTLYKTDPMDLDEVINALGFPIFVKPSNGGSSLGITKVKHREDLQKAVAEAFLYDHKVLLEEYIEGREIECSVLGNEHPKASLPGEVIPHHEFYSYEAKYVDEQGASFHMPARISDEMTAHIQDLAIKVFKCLCCHGMARVDFFLTPEDKVYLNEINTVPGFTQISLYPKLWEVSGLSCEDLVKTLLDLGLEKYKQDQALLADALLNKMVLH